MSYSFDFKFVVFHFNNHFKFYINLHHDKSNRINVYTHIYLVCFSDLQNFVLLKTNTFYLLHIYPSISFFQNTLLRVQKKFFSYTLRSNLIFSWRRKVQKVTITIYCHLITDPSPSYIFINFLFTLKFWMIIFGFPKDFVLCSLILCIRNCEERTKNHNIYKIYCVTVLPYHLFYTFW